jgi:hypothetical protein
MTAYITMKDSFTQSTDQIRSNEANQWSQRLLGHNSWMQDSILISYGSTHLVVELFLEVDFGRAWSSRRHEQCEIQHLHDI